MAVYKVHLHLYKDTPQRRRKTRLLTFNKAARPGYKVSDTQPDTVRVQMNVPTCYVPLTHMLLAPYPLPTLLANQPALVCLQQLPHSALPCASHPDSRACKYDTAWALAQAQKARRIQACGAWRCAPRRQVSLTPTCLHLVGHDNSCI